MNNPFPLPSELRDSEKELIACAKAGEWCTLASARPAKPESGRNTVRSAVIMHLALGGSDTNPVHPRGVRLEGAWVDGPLNLEDCMITHPVLIWSCSFSDPLNLREAQTRTIGLSGSLVPSLNMDCLVSKGSLNLNKGFETSDTVFLRGAMIEGEIDCSGGKFLNSEGAFIAHSVVTGGSVTFGSGFEALGIVDLNSAKIGRHLSCAGGKFRCEGTALNAGGSSIDGSIHLGDGFEAEGLVNLDSAKVAGHLICVGGKFRGTKMALNASAVKIAGSVALSGDLEATGPILLRGTEIGGQLACVGGKFLGTPTALDCDNLSVGASVLFSEGFEALGTVVLRGAKIGGQLKCSAGAFHGRPEALNADSARIGRAVHLDSGFLAKGAVIFRGGRIGGQLGCRGGNFTCEKIALVADGLTTDGPILLNDGFKASGEVDLHRAQIGVGLYCNNGEFLGKSVALNLNGSRVFGVFNWKSIKLDQQPGEVQLAGAEIEELCDDLESWPRGKISIDGFRYRRIANAPTAFVMRRLWLSRQRENNQDHDFRPQPFEHLACILKEMGHGGDAKRVAMLKQDLERRINLHRSQKIIDLIKEELPKIIAQRRVCIDESEIARLDYRIMSARRVLFTESIGYRFRWVVSQIFRLIVGYGYRPAYSLLWAGLFVSIGWVLFNYAYNTGAIVPNNPVLLKNEWAYALQGKTVHQTKSGIEITDCPSNTPYYCFLRSVPDYQTFHPLTYSIDTFVPLVNLYQETYWIPQAEGKDGPTLVRLYFWVHIVFGWIITALAAASMTGIVKKDI